MMMVDGTISDYQVVKEISSPDITSHSSGMRGIRQYLIGREGERESESEHGNIN